jgi:hypothetical protein
MEFQDVSIYRNRAVHYQKVGFDTVDLQLVQKAIAEFSHAIEKENDAMAYYGRANCYLRLERWNLERASELASRPDNENMANEFGPATPSTKEIRTDVNSYLSRAFVYARLAKTDLEHSQNLRSWTVHKPSSFNLALGGQ